MEKNKKEVKLDVRPKARPVSKNMFDSTRNEGLGSAFAVGPGGISPKINYNFGDADVGIGGNIPFEGRYNARPGANSKFTGLDPLRRGRPAGEFTRGAPNMDAATATAYAKGLMAGNLDLQGTIDRDKNFNVGARFKPTRDSMIAGSVFSDGNYNLQAEKQLNDNLKAKIAYDKNRGAQAALESAFLDDRMKARFGVEQGDKNPRYNARIDYKF